MQSNTVGTLHLRSAWLISFLVCGVLSLSLLSQTSGPVAAYGLNEGTGTTTTDQSGNGITGLLRNTSWTADGKYSGALAFNGSSSYVDLGNSALLQTTGSMTWSGWVLAKGNS